VMVLCKNGDTVKWQRAVVAGFLVGGIAGAKYTGVLIAGSFLLAMAFESRSLALTFYFSSAALFSGMWPFLRNFLWTRDPIFPILGAKLAPHLVTSFGLATLASDSGASMAHPISHLLPFLFFAGRRPDQAPGLWDFFGPLILALGPLLLIAFRNTRIWRLPLLVWSLSGTAIFFSSGLPRFLLPVFPLALCAVGGGWEASRQRVWKIGRAISSGLVAGLLVIGLVGLAKYSARPLLAATGAVDKTNYLEQSAPDYQVVEAINHTLAGQDGHTLLFVRHMYFLDVPYLNGDPETSFEIDASRLQTNDAWLRLFNEKNISFVVRSPNYPESIAKYLLQMERDGNLRPFAQIEVQNFAGNRIDSAVRTIPVVILKVER
jgi:hypothetical protein